MDERTIGLISQLAAKLGTTAEHLWAILIRQAPISAMTDILQYAIVGVVVWFYIKWIRVKWDDLREGAAMLAGAGCVALGILVVVVFFTFPTTITALVNPDYWALDRVLTAIRPTGK